MPLERTPVQIDFSGGQDQRTAKKHVVPGRWVSLENARWNKDGEVENRLGTSVVATQLSGISMSAGVGSVLSYDNGLVVAERNNMGIYTSTYGSNIRPFSVTPNALFRLKRFSICNRDLTEQGQNDVATSGNLVAAAWEEGALKPYTGVFATIIDTSDNTEVLSGYDLTDGGTGHQPRVCVIGGVFIFIWTDNLDILARTYTVSTKTLSSITTIYSGFSGHATGGIDACSLSNSFVVAFQDVGAGPLKLCSFDANLNLLTSVSSTEVVLGNTYDTGISLCGNSSDLVWLAYVRQTATPEYFIVYETHHPTTLAEVLAPTVATNITTLFADGEQKERIGIGRISSTEAAIVASVRCTYSMCGSAWYVDSSGSTVTQTVGPNCSFTSKPFKKGAKMFAYGLLGGANPNSVSYMDELSGFFSFALLDLFSGDNAPRPYAYALPSSASFREGVFALTTPASDSSGNYYALAMELVQRVNASVAFFKTNLALVKTEFDYVTKWQSGMLGRSLQVSGGVPCSIDGAHMNEAGFLFNPESVRLTSKNGTGSLTSSKTYNYVVVWSYTNSKGEVIYSTPSTPKAITLGGADDTVDVVAPTYDVTLRTQPLGNGYPQHHLLLYRTEGNKSGPYYLIDRRPWVPYASDHLSIEDGQSDTGITTFPQLYTGLIGTTEAIVPNHAPAGFVSLAVSKGRCFGLDGENIWFSKLAVENEHPAYSLEFTIPVSYIGNALALAEMDGRIIVFSETSIHALTGEGPNDAGIGNDYTLTKVCVDRGCTNAKSIVKIPQGLLFQSGAGIYLLTRAFEVVWVGQEVQDDLASYPNITSAVVHPTDTVAIFTCVNTGVTEGVRLVCDFSRAKDGSLLWCKDKVYCQTASAPIISQAVVNGVLYFMDNTGRVYKEDSSTYLDNSHFVSLLAESANIHMGGLHGYQRCWRVQLIGTQYTACDVKLEIAFDKSDTFTQNDSWTSLEQVEMVLAPQRTSDVRVRISTLTPSAGSVGTGRGIAFSSLMAEVGLYSGARRLAAAQRG